MRLPAIMILITLLLQIATDAYLFLIAWQRCRKLTPAKIALRQGVFFLIYIVVFLCLPKRSDNDTMLTVCMWLLFVYVSIYLGKIAFVVVDLIASIPKLFKRQRLRWLTKCGMVLGVAIFAAMWWGALINRFNIDVNKVDIPVERLPQSFSGYRIVQISDLHVGTYGSDTTYVSRVVDKVNSLHPNLIVFTGDIVNRYSGELPPFVPVLKRLDAPDGVISILGNHDYGDYHDWPTAEAKEENMEQMMDLQIAMNWELLTNNSITLYGEAPADSLVIIGVENWGDPPFPTYGNLREAYSTPGDSAVKILLTHNPVHWEHDVEHADSLKIDLTLSGHTHAMQMAAGRISPAAWRYKEWGGLYQSPDGKRPLYVNIGIGTVGMPMRLGATPEITVFTLLPQKKR